MSYVFVPWCKPTLDKVVRVSLPPKPLQKSVQERVSELEKKVVELEIKLKEK